MLSLRSKYCFFNYDNREISEMKEKILQFKIFCLSTIIDLEKQLYIYINEMKIRNINKINK